MFYDENRASLIIDAKELCEIAEKRGNIDARYPSHRDGLRVARPDEKCFSKIYRDIEGYCLHDKELEITYKYDEICYTVAAVVDTVYKKDGKVRIDMVCEVTRFQFFAPPGEFWLSYLKCCGLLYMKEQEISQIGLRIYLVMTDKDGESVKHFDYFYSIGELEAHFLTLLKKISHRGYFAYNKKKSALPSAAGCLFPYEELREGQEIMIKECYYCIKQGKRLFLQAPTGTGKTVAALYPAVRALGNGLVDKIFYLTSKASTRREAFRGAAKLFEAGAKLRTVVIGAKEQVCMCASRAFKASGASLCNPEECSYAKGYYDKVESAITELLFSGHGYTVRRIAEVAKKHEVCPYELSLDLSELCDIIICDYNYVFDPSVYFRRYFSADALAASKYVFLVDEAHNLVDRARDMYSASFKSDRISSLYNELLPSDTELKKIFGKILGEMSVYKSLCHDTLAVDNDGVERGFYVSNSLVPSFTEQLELFKKKCDAWLKTNKDHELWGVVSSIVADARKYLCVSEYFDKRFYNCVYVEGDTVEVRIFCLDPSYVLDKIQKRARASVLFSATLTPLDYFSQILGGGKDAVSIDLPSAFDPSNLCVAVAGYLSTRFSERKESTAKYVSVIAATASRKAGNYIAYFPSYECMSRVYSEFSRKYPDVDTVIQQKNMTLAQKETFLDFFKDDTGILRIGFCVLGGSFSEGVDLPGARLIGTIIFGVGLSGLSSEKNIIKDYYDNRGEIGYDFAHTFPGMNNVLQAAGRVIRRDDDRGVVVLADDRYCEEKYTLLFPEHWVDVKKANNASELAKIIQNFWSNHQN